MATDKNMLEFERIRNLVNGFGWTVRVQQITDDKLIMTLEKPRVVPITGAEGMPQS